MTSLQQKRVEPMKTSTRWSYFLGSLAVVGIVALVIEALTGQPDLSPPAASSVRAVNVAPPVASAPVSPASLVSSVSPTPPRHEIPAYQMEYRKRENLGVLVHNALRSGDRDQLAYARLYIIRCSELSAWGRGDIDSLIRNDRASTVVAAAIKGFEKMCDRPNMDPELGRLLSAIGAEQRRVAATTQAQPYSEGGDVSMEAFFTAHVMQKGTPLDNIAKCGLENPVLSALCDMAAMSAMCANAGCDVEFQMARMCALFYQCHQSTLDEQLIDVLKVSASADKDAFKDVGNVLDWWRVVRATTLAALKSYQH